MKKKSNERLAVGLMIMALLLSIGAWTISPALGITGGALFFIGAHLFYTERLQRRLPSPSEQKTSAAAASNDSAAS